MADDLLQYFSNDYFSARDRFRAATAADCHVESYSIDACGPREQPLTIDVARYGAASAENVVIVSSGLHGIEGFFGSAVQLAWLAQHQDSPHAHPGTAVLLLHALNPYGFAWLRRFNEDNVDPNRNFILPGEPYEGSPPGYAGLDGLLNPRKQPGCCELFFLKALRHILFRGLPALKQAVAAGQYEFPQGLFYGGGGPSRAMQILEASLPGWIGNCRRILHLDFHSGLGSWATYKLLAEYGLAFDERKWLANHFDAASIEDANSDGVAYQVRGGFGQWCKQLLNERQYTYLCAEFGTYKPLQVLAGLRAENRAVQWGNPQDEGTRKAKLRLRELFCPSSEGWRRRVLNSSVDLIQKGIAACSTEVS